MLNICIKTIAELKGMNFFIPSYQRGYRWTPQEVSDLLNDLNEFSEFDPTTSARTRKYCLQPLIVKKRLNGSYELVDGQQRLTTVFVFMKIVQAEIRSAKPPFSLTYETRDRSEKFLNELTDISPDDSSNIDFHHISNARNEINHWLTRQPDKSTAIIELNLKFRNATQFIWYEIEDNVNPIRLFEKVNLGKILLTNAELVKALFMNKDNFQNTNTAKKYSDKEIDKQQTQIAMQWERFEQQLQDDSFWFFLTPHENKETRIDLLFDILAKRYNDNLKDKIPETAKLYRTFLILNQKMKEYGNASAFVETVWKDVERLFAIFKSWYSDLDTYHRIGWLVRSKTCIESIEKDLRGKKKSEVAAWLDEEIKKHLKVQAKELGDQAEENELQYEDKSRDRIRSLLLLFNLVSLRGSSNRFPFDKYEKEKWDIEHIHAIEDKLPQKTEDKRAYLDSLSGEAKRIAEQSNDDKANEFICEINKLITKEIPDFDIAYEEWKSKFTDLLEEDNSVANLAILNADINRGYKNVTFFQKRSTILNQAKTGRFIPVCTQNVFLKLYAKEARDLFRWSDDDRHDYLDAIRETLKDYLS